MRLHRLQISAFGPFAGEQVVDFDELSSAGLFLLHGPTGSGKTSVLDAVCFALYGRVAGVRAGTSRLRSDHADPTSAPRVVCEFSVSGRRFEVARSPAWERPKKRGIGTTTEQARVLLREMRDGQWVALSQRIDEASHLLDDVLGLGHEQFTKLVLLPQGDFAAFLRADAETRRHMLERLFETDRFSAVQSWLREHQARLRRDADVADAATRELLARAEQAVSALPALSTPLPAGDDDPLADPVARVAALRALAVLAWEQASARRTAATTLARRAGARLERARTVAGRQAEHARASERHRCLVASASEREAMRSRISAAQRAAVLAPLLPPLRVAAAEVEHAAGELAVAAEAAAHVAFTGIGVVDLPDDEAVGRALAAAREEIGRLAAAETDARRLVEVEARAVEALTSLGLARARHEEARAGLEGWNAAAQVLREELQQAAARAALLDVAAARHEAATAMAAAAAEREVLGVESQSLRARRDHAREQSGLARQHWLDLRERRLEGMAAELASDLRDGLPCPVCGSSDHPAPSAAGIEVVTREAEQAAKAEVDAAAAAHEAADGTLAAVGARLAAVEAVAAGLDVAGATSRLADAAREVAEAASAAAGVERIRAQLDSGALAAVRAQESLAEASAALDVAQRAATSLLSARDDLRVRIDHARGEDESPTARRARLTTAVDTTEQLLVTRRQAREARRALDVARSTGRKAARDAGFADLDAAAAAALPEDRASTLCEELRRQEDELAVVGQLVADPDLAAAAGEPTPDVAGAAHAAELASVEDQAAARDIALCETAVASLDGLLAGMSAHLRHAAPVRQASRTASELSRCLEGTGGDNTRRISLAAYVLAARLDEVAVAASQRLAQMSGGRYTLVHADEAERGRGRSGLELQVVDGWTGHQRDTSSLSGGEAFYTSLALALGLADVVSAESGGIRLDTLFIDEGFGSLDPETLEEVMDVLDGLRSGGRAIGLVSHVPDLKDRIPARLEVVKGRRGSQLRLASAS